MQKIKQDKNYGIGSNLKKLRLRKGLSQIDVSRELDFYGLNVSRNTYNKMEHNKYPIRINELLALKLVFECDFDDLFEDIEYPKRLM